MSTSVIRYQAVDGSEWKSAQDADARDAMIQRVAKAVAPLGPRPTHAGFYNGEGFVRHSLDDVLSVKTALLHIFAERTPGTVADWDKRGFPLMSFDIGFCIRILDGSCPPLEKALGRLNCITEDGWEYGQYYFVLHPEKVEQIDLTDSPTAVAA